LKLGPPLLDDDLLLCLARPLEKLLDGRLEPHRGHHRDHHEEREKQVE